MVLGVDLGNYYTKNSKGRSFISKVSEIEPMQGALPVRLDKTMYLGEGDFDTEYRKAYKKNLLYLLKGAIYENCKVVIGLPLSQYKEDKDYLINRIMQSRLVDEVEVVPEGIVTVPQDYEGIVIDIGGRTTDICLISKEGNRRKLTNPYSIPKGMLNLESEFINNINSQHGLDLLPTDSERILKEGLFVYGEKKNYSMEVYKVFVESITRRIQVDYSIKTNNIELVGGGAEKLYMAFKNRIPQCHLIKNSFFANAIAYEQIGRDLWS